MNTISGEGQQKWREKNFKPPDTTPLTVEERGVLDSVIGPDARGAYRQAEDVAAAFRDFHSERERALKAHLEKTIRELDRADLDCVEYRKALTRGHERERVLREALDRSATIIETAATWTLDRKRNARLKEEGQRLRAALEPTDPAPSTEDATHIIIGKSETTLCGQDAGPRTCVPLSMDVPGWGAGCWTCLERAREAYEAIGKPQPTTEGVGGERGALLAQALVDIDASLECIDGDDGADDWQAVVADCRKLIRRVSGGVLDGHHEE